MDKFKPTFDSLSHYQCPEWFRNAKFGIWSHWGAQSVPMVGAPCAISMYRQGSECYLHHLRHYGHPSKVGYKDICQLWKAEHFDPDGLMQLYKKAGARYFVGQAVHHDNFLNYDSKLNRFNSVRMGPEKDICGLWKAAAEREGLPFGLSEHLSEGFVRTSPNKGADSYGPYKGIPYDGNDPEYRDLYFDNHEHYSEEGIGRKPRHTGNEEFQNYWLAVVKEIVDQYQPDLFYTDGPIPFSWGDAKPGDPSFEKGLELISYLYNASIEKYGENRAVYNQKEPRPDVCCVGVVDTERCLLPRINPEPWQIDTTTGEWFYDPRVPYKQPDQLIETLVDVVSKNGCMLLNIPQRPDGTIDEESQWILEQLGDWFAICGDAIYDTRPWRRFGEGDTLSDQDERFDEGKATWNSSDFRFTTKGNTLYAFMMSPPENRVAVIKSLSEADKVQSLKLLGSGECEFNQSFGVLTVSLPEKLPTAYTNVLAIEIG